MDLDGMEKMSKFRVKFGTMDLKYKNEEDKCYGITGMAVSVVVLDADELVSAISLDAEGDEVVEFAPEFYFNGNPRLSAKVAWNHLLQHYQVSMGMLISNVLCRAYVLHKKQVDDKVRKALLKLVDEEGRETCSLESDEIERLFNKNYSYLYKVFNHTGVQRVVQDFAKELTSRRRLTRGEILEQLRALQML
jgi:hypothetical protein